MLSRSSGTRALLAVAASVAALGLAACGGDDESSAGGGGEGGGEPAAAEAKPVKMAIIQEARAAASPWPAAMHDSVEQLKKEDPALEVEENYLAFDPAAAVPVMRQYLDGGFDVLVMHSFVLEQAARETIAPAYPDANLMVPSFTGPLEPNLTSNLVKYLDAGYAACWLLSRLSESGKVGFVGAEPVPYAKELQLGCEAGAEAANPDAEVLAVYSGSFTDQQATYEQSRSLIGRGVDVLLPGSATADSIGGFKLCEQRKIPCAGWVADARRYAPNTAVTSAIVDWTQPLKTLVEDARAGETRAEAFNASFSNGGLVTPPFEGPPAELVPEDVRAEFEEVVQGLADETIELPKSLIPQTG